VAVTMVGGCRTHRRVGAAVAREHGQTLAGLPVAPLVLLSDDGVPPSKTGASRLPLWVRLG